MDPSLARLDEDLTELLEAADRQPKSPMVVRFSIEAMENPDKSKEKGRPVFDDVEMISIRIPGDPDIRVRPVRADDKQQYAKQYLAFKQNQNQETSTGTPLAQWAPMKRSQVEEAKFLGVHTVEQLSEVADVHLQKLGPGWLALRQKARDWLVSANDGAALSKMRDELEEANRRIATMENMLAKQAAELQNKPLSATSTVTIAPAKDPEVAELKAMVAKFTQMMDDRAADKTVATEVVPPRRKPGRPSKADLAARAGQNGEQKG